MRLYQVRDTSFTIPVNGLRFREESDCWLTTRTALLEFLPASAGARLIAPDLLSASDLRRRRPQEVFYVRQFIERQSFVSERDRGLSPQNIATRPDFQRVPDSRRIYFGMLPDLNGLINSSLIFIEVSQPFRDISRMPHTIHGEPLEQELFRPLQTQLRASESVAVRPPDPTPSPLWISL